MRSTLSLAWKEYREQRWFLLIALAIFCGFPLIEATGRLLRPPISLPGNPSAKAEFYSDSAVGIVLGLGGVLAIFVAVGATTRDLRDELHIFWRSRPVGAARWMGVKYLAGLFTVLLACTVPVLMQLCMAAANRRTWVGNEIAGAIGLHSFTLVLIFSIAFLLGCLVRHTTHAALLALAAALLIYFLPAILAPLSFLSVFNLMNREVVQLGGNVTPNPAGWAFYLPLKSIWRVIVAPGEWTVFALAMLGGSIAAASLALVAVARDWRVEADRKAMHWSLGAVAMVLFGATAFQVGSNLKVRRQFDLPLTNYTVADSLFDGTRGALLLRDMSPNQSYGQVRVKLCSVEMTDGGVRYGPVVSPGDKINVPYRWNGRSLFFRPQRPDRAYMLAERSGWTDKIVNGSSYQVTFLQLLTIDLTGQSADPVVHRLDLLPLMPNFRTSVRAYQSEGRVYLASYDSVLPVELDGSDAPRALPPIDVTVPAPGGAFRVSILNNQIVDSYDATGRAVMNIQLPSLPGLSPRQCLAARLALGMSNTRSALDGDLLVTADTDSVSTYRLTSIDDKSAAFALVGRREHTPLERLVGSYTSSVTLVDGLAYVEESRLGSGVSVYDLRDAAHPRAVGHFATPRAAALSVWRLASGELSLAGDRLYVLEPPQRLE